LRELPAALDQEVAGETSDGLIWNKITASRNSFGGRGGELTACRTLELLGSLPGKVCAVARETKVSR
jgi:hypothetical protein